MRRKDTESTAAVDVAVSVRVALPEAAEATIPSSRAR